MSAAELTALSDELQEASIRLDIAKIKAARLRLPGTLFEICRAISHVEGVIAEIKSKAEPEFEPFRSVTSKGADHAD